MQKINILGTELKDRTKWEALGMAENYLKTRAVHVILYISSRELNMASQEEEFRRFIEDASLTLWSNLDVSQMAGLKNDHRHKEVADKEFLQELLRRLAKNHKAVLLLAKTQEDADTLKQELFTLQAGLSVVSSMVLPDAEEYLEQTVNQINSMAPAVIIAKMPVEDQYQWLSKAKKMISAAVWLALPEDMNLTKPDHFCQHMMRKARTVLLKRKVKNTSRIMDRKKIKND